MSSSAKMGPHVLGALVTWGRLETVQHENWIYLLPDYGLVIGLGPLMHGLLETPGLLQDTLSTDC